ncbi:MAG: ABZJ_00895 family protein [Pseudomonadota bacterium]
MTFVLVALGAVFVITLLIMAAGINISSAAVQLIPAIAAAMIEGQRHAKSGAELPSKGQIWRAAFAMTGMAMGLFLFWSGLQFMQMPADIRDTAVPAILVASAVFLPVYLFANWWFYKVGFQSGQNRAAR